MIDILDTQIEIYEREIQFFLAYYANDLYFHNHNELKFISDSELAKYELTEEYNIIEDIKQFKKLNHLIEYNGVGFYYDIEIEKKNLQEKIAFYKDMLARIKADIDYRQQAFIKAIFEEEYTYYMTLREQMLSEHREIKKPIKNDIFDKIKSKKKYKKFDEEEIEI